MIKIIIDESIERLDKRLTKVNVCCVESEDNSLDLPIVDLKRKIEEDDIRFPKNQKKLHFSEMNDAQKSIVIEIISKLPIRVKVYSFYTVSKTGATAKCEAVSTVIDHLLLMHKNKKVLIEVEHAEEYVKTKLEKYLDSDIFKFLVPDAFLSIYGKHLSEIGRNSTSSNVQFYKLIEPKIRLQTFYMEKNAEYLSREDRI